ncbi:MAG TPA: hypothetical protein VF595_02865 [Tepidisphaeraceae bacterium]|jgi:hypothetical protein
MPLGDAEAVVTFEDKLRQQTGWPRSRAARAIDEYRRFLLLAATAGHPVSPSPAVDEAWHLHLLYTRHYWKTLCPDVLGLDLHHEPATGEAADRTKLDDWYVRTLASYRAAFGEPPDDLWPARPTEPAFIRIDSISSVVLPRRAWRLLIGLLATIAVAITAALVWIVTRGQGGLP